MNADKKKLAKIVISSTLVPTLAISITIEASKVDDIMVTSEERGVVNNDFTAYVS